MKSHWFYLLSATLTLASLRASSDLPIDSPQNDSLESLHGKPVASWNFEGEVIGTWQGQPKIGPSGPQQPMFPNFPKGNKAAMFSGKDSALIVKECDLPQANLRFQKGDAVTIEAWVNPTELKSGSNAYVIGKGRNRKKEFATENQNYALRLKGEGGAAHISFLFRTESEKFDGNKDYHRWTSDQGFDGGSGWHHIAVSYTFGKADSIKGFVDGKAVKGKWDMGGKTDKAPLNDADDVVIGTGNGGGTGNSFRGWLDEVAIYREVLPDAVFAQRYQFVPQPPVVDARKLPKGKVRVEICEDGVPEKNAWPAIAPKATESYEEDAFGIFEVPQKYVDTGVRGDRHNPYLLRTAANVKLPAGKHRLLLRARSAARVYVDGKQILSLPFNNHDGSGHGHVSEQDGFLSLGQDFRFAPPGTQEIAGEIVSKGKPQLILVEQMVGGMVGKSKHRPETGEMVLAISREGRDSWELISPGARTVPYTDAGWAVYQSERSAHLAKVNAEHR
ncbi:MAG TPA: LamG-like jellyroll fold domain-containing protein, partial [Verrucomicrobiaceae bacterium]